MATRITETDLGCRIVGFHLHPFPINGDGVITVCTARGLLKAVDFNSDELPVSPRRLQDPAHLKPVARDLKVR